MIAGVKLKTGQQREAASDYREISRSHPDCLPALPSDVFLGVEIHRGDEAWDRRGRWDPGAPPVDFKGEAFNVEPRKT